MFESAAPLLATKLFMPSRRENFVIRPRLHYRLSKNPNCRLVLVTAPAGSGKTTLVTSWLQNQKKKAAWLSLDQNDNDPLIFLSYVAAAVHSIDAGTCETIRPLLQSSDPPPTTTLLAYFINDLTCLEEQAILVLDDYHAIRSPKVDEVTAFLIEHKPPNLQIIITSRHMPPFSVSRWRAWDEIVEINASDLVFNYDESWHFLHKVIDLDISDKDVAMLCERTEGWITGLQLAGLGLRSHHRSGDDFIHEMSGDDRLIGDYLVDEVVEQQTLAVRQFLVRTSILHRLSAPLCNALLKIDNAQELLIYLEQSNLFLIALDNRRIWYRYHHLFGEMLRARLDQKQPQLVPELFQRAIQWHLDNDLVIEAIDYAMAAEEYEQAANLIERNLERFQLRRERLRIIRWVESIPDEILKENDPLWTDYILSLFDFADFDIAVQTLQRLWHQAPIPPAKVAVVKATEIPLMAAVILHTTLDAHQVRDLTQEALEIMPDELTLMKGIAKGHHGSSSVYLGELDTARRNIYEALDLVDGTVYWSIANVFRNYLAEILALEGKLSEAMALYEENQQYVIDHGMYEGNIYATTLVGLGLLHYEWNHLDQTEQLINEGVRLADVGRFIEAKMQACLAKIRLNIAKGDSLDIENRLTTLEAEAAKFNSPPLVMDRISAMRTVQALYNNDLAYAESWAERFSKRNEGQVSFLQQSEWMVVARSRLMSGNTAGSVALLKALFYLAKDQNRQRDVIRIGALLARSWFQLGDEERGLSLLAHILTEAEGEGYIRSFVDPGPVMLEMLKMILVKNSWSTGRLPSHAYVQDIVNAFPERRREQRTSTSLLTPRESEILLLLAEGLSYAQVTDRLVITENTLKTHIKRIYSKLHVNNRMQAVIAAQELGIL